MAGKIVIDGHEKGVFSVICLGIIYDPKNKKILIGHRANDPDIPALSWCFPGGRPEYNEELETTVKREIKEETGLDVEIVKFLDKFIYLADGGTRKSICYNFLCKMKDPNQKIKLSNEHDSYRWITQMGEIDLMVAPEQRRTFWDC